MRYTRPRAILVLLILFLALAMGVEQTTATPARQFDDLVRQGEYLATIAGCVGCHTPFKPEYADLPNLTTEQARTLALFERDALDEDRLFAGGRVFSLGPAGLLASANLTPDEETGLGAWTDEEIKTAIQTGASRDGRQLFPLMPYPLYNNMADADVAAIIAYLRSLPPVENKVPEELRVPTEGMPSLPLQEGITAPDPEDTAARGRYLATAVMGCTDCHTPADPNTGQPILEQYLAGGQPFEGPWGIVYGGNITPHPETGIGDWSEADLRRALISGIRPDGRRLVVMPWQFFAEMTADDATALVHYLQNDLQPVDREVPAAALAPEFVEHVEPLPDVESPGPNWFMILGLGVALVALAAIYPLYRRSRPRPAKPGPVK
ncbi:MAG: c-type cytochrome [Chloroflexi bacterium]|nr:c-type cytochrome [Chloroflexota bacterium]MCI0576075.1 c-type cytochrome [Chloroflexota bacterium]MCI0647863.1 c-type cytochrome [Chloroflexota bacterium]MCI0727114.1 c-type cytochrome [Chloroflexota bacterium]